jgi:fructose-1,6-bisphosphatase II
MLFNGEAVGDGVGPEVDVAVDPLEDAPHGLGCRTRSPSSPCPSADDVLSGRRAVHGQDRSGSEAAGAIDIDATPTENLERVAEAKHCAVNDLTVVVLERERHDDLIAELREAGAREPHSRRRCRAGDRCPAGTGVDLLMGIGGTPEGVISAAAISASAARWGAWPRSDDERQRLLDGGFDLDRVLTADDPSRAMTCSSQQPA